MGRAAATRWPRLAPLLRRAITRRQPLRQDEQTDVYRLVHGRADGLEGVVVEAYGDYWVLYLTTPAVAYAEQVLDELAALGPRGIYLKLPPKQASRVTESERSQLAPSRAVRGSEAPDPLVVVEQGLHFETRLGRGLATGLYLDQRPNRQRVRQLGRDARVLNLFGYTGGFTVAAIAGGARRSITVDISRPALAWARRNLELAGDTSSDHRLLREDVVRWLPRQARREERFDLVILDPPSFATTKHSRFRELADYQRLAAAALECTAPGGRLLACTNHRQITWAKLREDLLRAATTAGCELAALQRCPPGDDFPAEPASEPHPKSLLVTRA